MKRFHQAMQKKWLISWKENQTSRAAYVQAEDENQAMKRAAKQSGMQTEQLLSLSPSMKQTWPKASHTKKTAKVSEEKTTGE